MKRLDLKTNDAAIKFDLDIYVEEIFAGIQEANTKYDSNLEVQEIEVVPYDNPKPSQVRYVAYLIAKHVLTSDE